MIFEIIGVYKPLPPPTPFPTGLHVENNKKLWPVSIQADIGPYNVIMQMC